MEENYTKDVYFKYEDDVFKDCVPSENRKQILHQSMVTDLQYVLFAITILVDGESQII